jgi:hypothetical protein
VNNFEAFGGDGAIVKALLKRGNLGTEDDDNHKVGAKAPTGSSRQRVLCSPCMIVRTRKSIASLAGSLTKTERYSVKLGCGESVQIVYRKV